MLIGRISLDGYRRQWPRVGGVLAMAVGGATALAERKVTAMHNAHHVNRFVAHRDRVNDVC